MISAGLRTLDYRFQSYAHSELTFALHFDRLAVALAKLEIFTFVNYAVVNYFMQPKPVFAGIFENTQLIN